MSTCSTFETRTRSVDVSDPNRRRPFGRFVWAVSALLGALLITACGTTTLEDIEERGIVRIGLSAGSPLVAVDPDGATTGFEPELAHDLADRIVPGLPVTWSSVTAAQQSTVLSAGDVDMLLTRYEHGCDGNPSLTTPYVMVDGGPRAIATAAGDLEFRNVVEGALQDAMSDGTWEALHTQWLGSPAYSTADLTAAEPTVRCTISIVRPRADERFVTGENVEFSSNLASPGTPDTAGLVWTSDRDGQLGTGDSIEVGGLSPGGHQIEVAGFGQADQVHIRVFSDLGSLYLSQPAASEIERVESDFNIVLMDGAEADEQWSALDATAFDPSSKAPSKQVIVARLDLLRRQRFDVPLPLGGPGPSAYEYVAAHVDTITLRLDCGLSTGGGRQMSLSRGMSSWFSGSADCKDEAANTIFNPYVSPLQLLVHEARHSDPGDPGHVRCPGADPSTPVADDQAFEDGSGYAWGATYAMWVHSHGQHDSPDARDRAGAMATGLLKTRFCEPPSHSDPQIQALIDALLNG